MTQYIKYIGPYVHSEVEVRKTTGPDAKMLIETGKWVYCSKKQYKAFKKARKRGVSDD